MPNDNKFFSDKSGNLEGLGSFDLEPNLAKPKPTFSGNPVDYLKKTYPPGNVNPNIRPPPDPIRSSDQIDQGSGDQFMGYFGDQQSVLDIIQVRASQISANCLCRGYKHLMIT